MMTAGGFIADFVTYAMIPAFVALGGAVALMYKNGRDDQKRTQKKLDDCEDAHQETQLKIVDLAHEVGELRGRINEREDIVRAVALTLVKDKAVDIRVPPTGGPADG